MPRIDEVVAGLSHFVIFGYVGDVGRIWLIKVFCVINWVWCIAMHMIGIGDHEGSNCVRWEVEALHVEFCPCDGLKEYYLVVYRGFHLLHSSFQTQS